MDLISESNEFFLKSVVENAPFPIGIYAGYELRIVLANQAMLKTLGKGNDVVGKLYTAILPELENQEIFEQIRGVLETGIPYYAKDKRVDIVIDGTLKTHYFNYSFTPLFDQAGKVYAVMNTGAEVTDLNATRQQIQDAEERLRLAIESADLGIYESDLKTNEVKTSGKFSTIWDIEKALTRQDIIQRIHPDDRAIREEAHRIAGISGKLSYEVRIIHRNNEIRWVRINGSIKPDKDGLPSTLIGIAQDITEHKQFTQQLAELVEKRTKDLQRSNEDLVQFAHVVSHDLKEPVRKIKIFNDVLKSNFADKLDEKGKEYLEKMHSASDRIFLIIDDVLAYSTINSSGYPPQTVDLNEIMTNIKSDLELMIHEKKAILIMDELPVIEGAPILIHQLFYNLVNNALKFSKSETPPRVTISASVHHDGEPHVSVVVKDNGIGIDPEYAERIFEAFERLHAKNEYEGTGLGLSLCKKIVERHNGSIHVSGQLNEGCEFIVHLPLKQQNRTI